MIVYDIIGFESRLTIISSNFLGTKIYGTLAVDSEFKSGMENISSDVAKEFAEPFKKEVSFIHSFIHSSFLSFFLLLLLQPCIFKSTIHSYIVLYLLPLYIGLCQVKL